MRISSRKCFIPDGIVYCGERETRRVREIANPIIVAEVLSDSTKSFDLRDKLEGYFQVLSIEHYLIVDPDKPLVIHYARGNSGPLQTTLTAKGMLRLDPPSLDLDIEAIFAEDAR